MILLLDAFSIIVFHNFPMAFAAWQGLTLQVEPPNRFNHFTGQRQSSKKRRAIQGAAER